MSMALYNLGLGMAPESNVVQTQDEVLTQARQRAALMAQQYEQDKQQAAGDYRNYITQQATSFYGDKYSPDQVNALVGAGIGGVNASDPGNQYGTAGEFLRNANLGGAWFYDPAKAVGPAPDTSGFMRDAQGQVDQMNQSHGIQQQAYDGILNGGGFGGGVINGGTTTSMFGTPMNSGAGTSSTAAWGASGGFGGLGGLGGFSQAGKSAQQPQQTWGGPFSVQNPWSAR